MKNIFIKAVETINKGLCYLICVDIQVSYKKGSGYFIEEHLKVFNKTIKVETHRAKDIARVI